jgi:hypothetical protein
MRGLDLPQIPAFKKKALPPKKNQKENFMEKISDKIDENYRVSTWADSNFKFEIIDIEPITKSLFLMNDEKFKELVNIIIGYNQEIVIAQNSGKPNNIRNGPWRSQYFSKLYALLREVVITKDRPLQQNYLERAYNWAFDTKKQMDIGAPPEDESLNKKVINNSFGDK